MKCSDTSGSSNMYTFKLINEVRALTFNHCIFSVMAGLIAGILFMLFSTYNIV